MKIERFLAALGLAAATSAQSVSLNPDGLGQALIYPYYSVQSSNGNPYNTYVTIVNHTADAKVVRVRFREGRNSREVASFNLFLSPNDAWAGAVVGAAGSDFARIIAGDRSCTSPAFVVSQNESAPGITFNSNFYTGSFLDGQGTEAARTREGFIEVIEMATVVRATAQAVTHVNGVPPNCASVQGTTAFVDAAVPSGGISGTLTIINVANGMDFAVNAEALADLSNLAFYRPAEDFYPDFNAVEVLPVSMVTANGFSYRSTWNRGADAVSAVLMRSSWAGELILDQPTNSHTEFAVTFPTRQFYIAAGNNPAPFNTTCVGTDTTRGEPMALTVFNREEGGGTQPQTLFNCLASPVFELAVAGHSPAAPTTLLGSRNVATAATTVVPANTQSGWAKVNLAGLNRAALTSLFSSTRTSLATGAVTNGSHQYFGLPLTGFSVRSFENGTLVCTAGACQGNYGAAFPLKYTRSISP
jgi:hypothetical protein